MGNYFKARIPPEGAATEHNFLRYPTLGFFRGSLEAKKQICVTPEFKTRQINFQTSFFFWLIYFSGKIIGLPLIPRGMKKRPWAD